MTPLAIRIAETVQQMLEAEDSTNTVVLLLAADTATTEGNNAGTVLRGNTSHLAQLVRGAKGDSETGTIIKAIILANTFS